MCSFTCIKFNRQISRVFLFAGLTSSFSIENQRVWVIKTERVLSVQFAHLHFGGAVKVQVKVSLVTSVNLQKFAAEFLRNRHFLELKVENFAEIRLFVPLFVDPEREVELRRFVVNSQPV